jgi:hypothetical protein
VRSDEWPAWLSFWFSGCWRALAKGTAWASFCCAILLLLHAPHGAVNGSSGGGGGGGGGGDGEAGGSYRTKKTLLRADPVHSTTACVVSFVPSVAARAPCLCTKRAHSERNGAYASGGAQIKRALNGTRKNAVRRASTHDCERKKKHRTSEREGCSGERASKPEASEDSDDPACAS